MHMIKIFLGFGLVLVIAAGALWKINDLYSTSAKTAGLDSYTYDCDEHVMFKMKPASDMSVIKIAPVNNQVYPPTSTLIKMESTSGVRYEGNGVVFTAKGETVTLGEGNSAINCSPVQNGDNAPINFGD